MSFRNTYPLDEEKAFNSGFRIEFFNAEGEVVSHVDVRYAGPSNKKFTAFRNAFMKPHERKISMGSMPEAESDKLLQECFVRAGIIAGWSEPIPVTVENFRAAMEEAPPETWRDIMSTAFNIRFYTPITQEAEAGNSISALLHRLEWGTEKKRDQLEQWKQARGTYPAAYLDSPEVYPWLKWYMDAWDDLSRSRQCGGMGPGPIPASEILAYCTLMGIEWQEVREALFHFCGALDNIYVGWANSKDEEKDAFILKQREHLRGDNGYC